MIAIHGALRAAGGVGRREGDAPKLVALRSTAGVALIATTVLASAGLRCLRRSAIPNWCACTGSRCAAECCSTARPCGKTFIARALAGEMDARFLAVSLADVLDMYIGQSERNVHEIFGTARRNAPCVVFLDEVDALRQKRSQLRASAARGTVNQLLSEMDGVASSNHGVFVLGATNHPWDVDVALRRPGRFDRMLLVLPPDATAREAILRYHLRERPIAKHRRAQARPEDGGLLGC